jgi:outer membrane biosynthesis protein TonB
MKYAFFVISIAIRVTAPLISGQRNDTARHPFLVHGDLPSYPGVAKTARISGAVRVRVTVVNRDVVGTEVVSGHPILTSAATENVKTWKFDKTVSTSFATTFIYQLEMESEETADPSNPKLELELPSLAKITAKAPMVECNDCGGDAIRK